MMHQERYQATIALPNGNIDINLILSCNSEQLCGALVDAAGCETPLTLGHVFGDKVAFRGELQVEDETGHPVRIPFHCFASRSATGISGLLKTAARSLSLVGTRELPAVPEREPVAA